MRRPVAVSNSVRPVRQLHLHAAGGGQLLSVPERHPGRLLPADRDEQTLNTAVAKATETPPRRHGNRDDTASAGQPTASSPW